VINSYCRECNWSMNGNGAIANIILGSLTELAWSHPKNRALLLSEEQRDKFFSMSPDTSDPLVLMCPSLCAPPDYHAENLCDYPCCKATCTACFLELHEDSRPFGCAPALAVDRLSEQIYKRGEYPQLIEIDPARRVLSENGEVADAHMGPIDIYG